MRNKFQYAFTFAIAALAVNSLLAEIKTNPLFSDGMVLQRGMKAPVAARYAWASNPKGANLYNKEGLPAALFTTE